MIYPFTICLLISLFIPISETCFAWGGCGFGGCGGGCGIGLICRKAHAAKTLKDESSGDPDTDFRICCEDSGLPKGCLNKCNYKDFTKDNLIKMFLQLDSCPISAAPHMQRCATREFDHTECCKRNGVHTTIAGDKCLLFCKSDNGNATILDISYLPCLERFDSANSCFWNNAMKDVSDKKEEDDEGNRIDEGVMEGDKENDHTKYIGIQKDDMNDRTSKWELAKKKIREEVDDDEYEEFENKK